MWSRRCLHVRQAISISCLFPSSLCTVLLFVFSLALPRDPVSANLFVRAVDSAVLSTIGSYASIRGNDFPDASSLIVFASSTAFVVPLRKASMHVGAAFSLPSHIPVLLLSLFCGSRFARAVGAVKACVSGPVFLPVWLF